MDYKQILERLSAIRAKKNLSAMELGKILGNSDTYIYKIEDGSIILSVPKLLEILEVLEVPVEEFFYKNIQQYREDMEVQNILRTLSKEEFKALMLLLERKK